MVILKSKYVVTMEARLPSGEQTRCIRNVLGKYASIFLTLLEIFVKFCECGGGFLKCIHFRSTQNNFSDGIS